MILAIVGSVALQAGDQTKYAANLIKEALSAYDPELVISGGAAGIDTLGKELAERLGYAFEEFLPENNRWEPNGFKARNTLIAEKCTHLLCIRTKQSTTYGSGWTADLAEKLGKHVWRFTV